MIEKVTHLLLLRETDDYSKSGSFDCTMCIMKENQVTSSAKKFLQKTKNKRADAYLGDAATNLKVLQEILEQYRPSDQEDIMKAIKEFLTAAEAGEATTLKLPVMGLGLLSSLLQNCALYTGNTHMANTLKAQNDGP